MKWGLSQGILGRARESLAPSLTALGPNTYLTRADFFKMIGFAFLAHMLIFGIASLFPHQKVTNIPVRALSFKLGDQDKVAAYGTPTGIGLSSTPIAPPSMQALAAEGGRIGLTSAPAAIPRLPAMPHPVKPAKIMPVAAPKPVAPVPTYTPPTNAPAIAPLPQQYVREVGQATPQMAQQTPNSAGYGVPTGAVGGQGLETTQTEQTAREIRERYTQLVSNWINRHQIYPADGEGRSGRVVIRMRIDRGGTVRYYAIDQSSGAPALDNAAIDMIRRANPMPAVPDNYSTDTLNEFTIPINFHAPQ